MPAAAQGPIRELVRPPDPLHETGCVDAAEAPPKPKIANSPERPQERRMIEHKNTILAIVLSLHRAWSAGNFSLAKPQMERQQRKRNSSSRSKRSRSPARRSRRPATAANGAHRPAVPGAPGSVAQPAARKPRAREAVIAAVAAHSDPDADASAAASTLRAPASTISSLSNTARRSIPIRLRSCCSRRRAAPQAFYAEFGWVPAAGATEKMPGPDTVWKQEGSGALTAGHPVTLDLRQRRRLDLPPHHRGRRPLSVHPQRRGAEQGQRRRSRYFPMR